MLQKPSKTRPWSALNHTAPLVLSGKQAGNSLHDNNPKTSVSRRDARLSIPSGGRSGFFSGLFSRVTPITTTTATAATAATATSYTSAPTSSSTDRPRPSPTATDPSTIPPDLTMRNISPDLYDDPAFSSDPRSHPLFVTNPDIPIDSPPPSPTLNARSHEPKSSFMTSPEQVRRTPSPSSPNDLTGERKSFHPKTSSPQLHTVYSSSSSESETASSSASTAMTPSTSLSSLSTSPPSPIEKSSQPRKGLIILNPPVPSPPPPSYDEANTTPMGIPTNTNRPQTNRAATTPILQSQPEPLEVPSRPATTPVTSNSRPTGNGRSNTGGNPRRARGLDPIDELDETNPLGLALHHGGPYEAIQRLIQNHGQGDRSTSQTTSDTSQARAHKIPRKPVSNQPFLADSVAAIPYVPFGAPLNIAPGQVVPRNFQPYTQPTPQPNPRSQPRHLQDISPNHLNQPPARSQVPSQSQPQPRPHLFAPVSQPRPPIPNVSSQNELYREEEELFGDFEDAYGGIEEDPRTAEVPNTLNQDYTQRQGHGGHPLQPFPEQHPSHPVNLRYGPADVHQTDVSGGKIHDDDDAVARALYVVALERARTAQKSSFADNTGLAYHNPEQPNSRLAYPQNEPSRHRQLMPDGRVMQQSTTPSRITNDLPSGAAPSRPPDPMASYGHNPPRGYQTYAVQQPRHNNSHNAKLDPPRRSYDLPAAVRNPQQSGPSDAQGVFDPHDPEFLIQQRHYAPSVQQSVASSSASRGGPPPRHVPKNLVMPTPLQNNSNIAPTRNGQAPAQSHVRFQPQPHVLAPPGSINAAPRHNTPPLPPPPPQPPRIQAQNIPMAADSRKVLRKRSSLAPAAFNKSHGGSGQGSHSMSEKPDWVVPGPGYPPPSRSKSESRPPASAPQKVKAPKRVLSKRK